MRTSALRRSNLFLSSLLMIAGTCSCAAQTIVPQSDIAFVWPGNGIDPDVAVWGHRDGMRIGLAPTPGPRGLIRIYTPYLDQTFPRVVNFISIEPSVRGQRGRDQSELQMSRDQSGQRGLSFWATDEIDSARPDNLATPSVSDDGQTLRLFVHTERFQNGAEPVIECIFRRNAPFEVELVTHAAANSAPMSYCVLSATMANFGQLRQIHLQNDKVVSAHNLWNAEPLDSLGFLPWRSWPAGELQRDSAGRIYVKITTDVDDPASAKQAPDVARHWKYVGKKAFHYWRGEEAAGATAAVNARKTYWMSRSPIPGGTAFENFELRVPFRAGYRFWFGVQADAK